MTSTWATQKQCYRVYINPNILHRGVLTRCSCCRREICGDCEEVHQGGIIYCIECGTLWKRVIQRLRRLARLIRYRIWLNLTYLSSFSKMIRDLVSRAFSKLVQFIAVSFQAGKYQAGIRVNINTAGNSGQYSKITIENSNRLNSVSFESLYIPPSILRGYEITFELLISALIILVGVIGTIILDPSILEQIGLVIVLILIITIGIVGYGIYERKFSQYEQRSERVLENSSKRTEERIAYQLQGAIWNQLSTTERNRLRAFFSNPSGAYSPADKNAIGVKIKEFLQSHGIAIAQSLAASVIFEIVKGILF